MDISRLWEKSLKNKCLDNKRHMQVWLCSFDLKNVVKTYAVSLFKQQQEPGKWHVHCQAPQGTALKQETSGIAIHSLDNPPQAAGD